MKRHDTFHVYIVRCVDGKLYTGYSSNLENRIKQHNAGQGSKYVKMRLPVQLVYAKKYKYYKNALHAEQNFPRNLWVI